MQETRVSIEGSRGDAPSAWCTFDTAGLDRVGYGSSVVVCAPSTQDSGAIVNTDSFPDGPCFIRTLCADGSVRDTRTAEGRGEHDLGPDPARAAEHAALRRRVLAAYEQKTGTRVAWK